MNSFTGKFKSEKSLPPNESIDQACLVVAINFVRSIEKRAMAGQDYYLKLTPNK